jgi:small subunit ribosomal protein S6
VDGNVTDYEILLLLDAELPDERQQEIVARARELLERGGAQFGRHDVWGRRKLAYEIDRKAEGAYHLLTFAADSDALDEVSRVLKITDGVLRHMAVRRPAAQRPVRVSGPGEGARGNREVSPATTDRKEAPAAKPPVRDSGPGEGPRGNREVSPATAEPSTDEAEEAVSAAPPEE